MNILEIKEELRFSKNVVICSHRNPDGDALGSSLALALFLKKLGHKITVIYPSEYPDTFEYMPDLKSVLIYDVHTERANQLIEGADMFFALDFNSLERIDRLGEKIATRGKPIHMIDHHIDPEPFYEFGISETTASSTSELIYTFIHDLEMTDKIDRDIACCIMTGLITDTGSFKYNTRPYTFEVAGIMQSKGLDVKELQDNIFNSMSIKQLKLLAHALNNRLEIIQEYRTAIIVLNKYDYSNFNIQRGDTEGIVNYLLMMKDVELAAFITQQPQIIKISLRSKGDISVQEIARDHFKGGGHKNAAGGAQYGSLTKVIQKFKEVIPFYMKKSDFK